MTVRREAERNLWEWLATVRGTLEWEGDGEIRALDKVVPPVEEGFHHRGKDGVGRAEAGGEEVF